MKPLPLLVLLTLILPMAGCLLPPKDTVPMEALWMQQDPDQQATRLVVFLPGRYDEPADFIRNHMVERLWASGIRADVVIPAAHLGYYYRRTFSERLEQDILQVARARGYASIWVVGVSLGGFGAVMFERDHPGSWDGIVLIAPFVGDHKDVLDRIHAAPDLQSVRFEMASSGDDYTSAYWEWMQRHSGNLQIPVFLGYTEQDRMVRDQLLLVDLFPAGRVVALPGRHTWDAWERLWQEILPGLKSVMHPAVSD